MGLDALLTVMNTEVEEQKESNATQESQRAGVQEETPEAPALPRSQSALHFLKQDSGPVGLESVMQQTMKLERIHQLSLPTDLFAHISAKTLDSYRNRI